MISEILWKLELLKINKNRRIVSCFFVCPGSGFRKRVLREWRGWRKKGKIDIFDRNFSVFNNYFFSRKLSWQPQLILQVNMVSLFIPIAKDSTECLRRTPWIPMQMPPLQRSPINFLIVMSCHKDPTLLPIPTTLMPLASHPELMRPLKDPRFLSLIR